ncbi:MAG: hypothetical protein ACRDH9_09825 [Actinomycetota bacterium]
MSRWRLIVIAALVLGLGGALIWTQVRGDDRTPSATSDPTPSPEPSPTPTAELLAAPDLTGEDFTRIVSDITSFLDRLSENPDPDRVGDVYSPRCPCYKERRKGLAALRDNGYRYSSAHTQVLSVEQTSGVGQSNRVVLEVTAREQATMVVDGEGQVVDEIEATPPTRYTFVLVRQGPDAPWRVTTLVRVGPVDEEGGG